jgi:APA family basic amino acid/polyamine antiporter
VDAPALARRIGLFDATMLVMGGIVGSGIFVTPAIVARSVTSPTFIIGAWLLGGLGALLGAFVYAELAARRPEVGGQYAYMREAFHPLVAFLYGWALLLVIQTGGMAAGAITFARYFRELVPLPIGDGAVAAIAVALLVGINCAGVRAGSTVQSVLMVLKIAAILWLVGCALVLGAPAPAARPHPPDGVAALGAAMVAVVFAYGGWQTACFVASEMTDARKNLPRALVIGVVGVITLYVLVVRACLRTLGADELARSSAPALDVMTRVLGSRGGALISAAIALSTLGFLSQSVLTAPRVYFAMAEDGAFFRAIGRVHPRSQVPVLAIVLQGALTIAIALAGTFETILNYMISIDVFFFGLTACSLFVFRRRSPHEESRFSVPGHPVTTLLFIALCWSVVLATFYKDPRHSFMGVALMLAGIPVYLWWKRR